MTIKFDLSINDIMAVRKHSFLKGTDFRRIQFLRILLPVVLGIILIIGHFYKHVTYPVSFLIVIAVISTAWVALLPKLITYSYMSRVKRAYYKPGNKTYLGKINISFSDDLVHINTSVSEESVKWEAFSRHEEISDYFLIYTGPYNALLIPKREINEEQTEELRSLLAEHVQQQ